MPVVSKRIVLKDMTCPVIRLDKARRRDKSVGLSISLGLHILIFILVGVSFVKPPLFGVDQGTASIDVDLMSADIEQTATATSAPAEEEQHDLVQESTIIPTIKEPREVITPQQGSNQQTIQSMGGAVTTAKPDYLNNPAPKYPDSARRRKQEGLVILSALIDVRGLPINVVIERSSGYILLDQAALKAVKKWRFQAVMVGSLPVEAFVRVPVKFQLTEE